MAKKNKSLSSVYNWDESRYKKEALYLAIKKAIDISITQKITEEEIIDILDLIANETKLRFAKDRLVYDIEFEEDE